MHDFCNSHTNRLNALMHIGSSLHILRVMLIIIKRSFACFACSATSQFAYSINSPAPGIQLLLDCIRFSCCSLIASAASRLCLLQLLLPDRVLFSCWSPIASASAAAPPLQHCCCTSIASIQCSYCAGPPLQEGSSSYPMHSQGTSCRVQG